MQSNGLVQEGFSRAVAEAGLQALRSIQKEARGHSDSFWLEFPALGRKQREKLRFANSIRGPTAHIFPKSHNLGYEAIWVPLPGPTGEITEGVVITVGMVTRYWANFKKGFCGARVDSGPIILVDLQGRAANDIGRNRAAAFCSQEVHKIARSFCLNLEEIL